ncbi:hypothetical protein FA95DRAFT_1681592 [Auriscalpium vulgare]|uniref:Uncharacterized protein n=1 Tax=Auriscalpium vulgare TaxID=40419 RepID=A0ACB8RK49_9AGAM|nr:hypothetical protein FA95DRAFT_1681592 [Auriscalpium vulgare]
MLPNRAARRKFSQWRSAHRILVYDVDSSVLPEGNNILGLLRKFRTELGVAVEPASPSPAGGVKLEHQLLWLKGGFQTVWRERHDLIDSEQAPDHDEDESPSPPNMASPTIEKADAGLGTSAAAARGPALRPNHLPMSAFTVSSTTSSQRSGAAHHQRYLGKQAAAAREHVHPSAPVDPASGESAPASGSVAYNPFYDTIRQNLELSQGITERITLRISKDAKERVTDLPFLWLREIGRWAGVDGEGMDDDDEGGGSGSGLGSGRSGSEMSGTDSGDDSGSGREHQDIVKAPLRVHFPATQPDVPHDDEGGEDMAEGSEALAMQFYRIELGEQRRLMGVMEHHSRESGDVIGDDAEGGGRTKQGKRRKSKKTSSGSGKDGAKGSTRGGHAKGGFPYSITAGVEKGAKNRYRNIWPFEHARVRLQKSKTRPSEDTTIPEREKNQPAPLYALKLPPASQFLPPAQLALPSGTVLSLPLETPKASSSDDYVNASYVQPIGTKKRYIATQGPLPETFNDFWLLVWEQNVHVIVMLTREVEGAVIKCGNYWSGSVFGPLRLKVVEVSGAQEEGERVVHPSGSFFPVMSKAPDRTPAADTIRRVLELTHTGYPSLPPRRVVQLQYLEWPDLNVPEDPRGVLKLIRTVERETEVSEEARGGWEGVRRPDHWRGRAIRSSGGSVRRITDEGSPSGTGSTGSSSPPLDDDVDANSGIVKHALGEHPVLLHCSAGVGRTGGFIAVDAVLDGVRREMRKSREGQLKANAAAGSAGSQASGSDSGALASGSGSGNDASGSGNDASGSGNDASGSGNSGGSRGSGSPRVEMDVDEASGGGSVVMKDAALATSLPAAVPVPVAAARPQLLRAASSASSSVPMDIDRKPALLPSLWIGADPRRGTQTSASSSMSPPQAPRMPPSRGSFTSLPPSSASPDSRSLSPDVLSDESNSMSPPGGLPRSFSALTSLSYSALPATAPPVDPRTRTFSVPTGRLGASFSSSPPLVLPSVPPRTLVRALATDNEESPAARSTAPSSLFSGNESSWPTDPSSVDLPSRIRGRGDVLRSSLAKEPLGNTAQQQQQQLSSVSPPQPDNDSPPLLAPTTLSSTASRAASPPAFDYTQPRRLHDDKNSPPLLSTLDEPIHRVIEDMREQRMSLCQSLRQYVFVHRAVIEGVLALVDEERELYGDSFMDTDAAERAREAERHAAHKSDAGMTVVQSVAMAMAMSGGSAKRGPSPTELPHEDKRGDARLAKRPSIKRRLRSSDEESAPEKLRQKTAPATPPEGTL